MSAVIPLLAHQGGWDEILMLVVPAVLVLGAITWTERRRKRRRASEEDGSPAATMTPPDQEDP
jgi:hypothetical protein